MFWRNHSLPPKTISPSPRGRGVGWARYQDIGNTLMSAHRLQCGFGQICSSTLVNNRTHCTRIVVVQMSDQNMSEVNGLHTSLDWFEADSTSDKRFADKSFSASPFDLTVAANLPLFPCRGIAPDRLVSGHAAGTLAIPAFPHLLTHRLVVATLVDYITPITPPL